MLCVDTVNDTSSQWPYSQLPVILGHKFKTSKTELIVCPLPQIWSCPRVSCLSKWQHHSSSYTKQKSKHHHISLPQPYHSPGNIAPTLVAFLMSNYLILTLSISTVTLFCLLSGLYQLPPSCLTHIYSAHLHPHLSILYCAARVIFPYLVLITYYITFNGCVFLFG